MSFLSRDEGGYNRFVLGDTRRGTEEVNAALFGEAVRKEKHRSKDLEEDANRRRRKEADSWKPM